MSLATDKLQGLAEEHSLENSYDSQAKGEKPIGVIRPASRYRHGGKFGDSYGLGLIFASYGVAGIFVDYGVDYIRRRRRSRGRG
jgi:hypothetical protein